MLIIRDKAEQKLIQAIESLVQEKNGKRCIHFRHSLLQQHSSFTMPRLQDLIPQYITDPQARLFICTDSDVYLVAFGISPSTFSELCQHIATLLDIDDIHTHMSLHEIIHEAHHLTQACTDKIERIQSQQTIQRNAPAASENENILTLPLDESLVQSIIERRSSRPHIKVLVVEDDPFSARMVKNAIQQDVSVSLAENGKSALQQYLSLAPDIVFLDINLPDVNGLDLLKRILSFDDGAYIIMLSGNSDKHNVLTAIQKGAKGFVGKPFSRDKLMHYIQKRQEQAFA